MNEKCSRHKYLFYEENKKMRVAVRYVAKEILNDYLQSDKSITQLKKMKMFKINCYEQSGDKRKEWKSENISYDLILENIENNNTFKFEEFKAVELKCRWLDGNIDISLPQFFIDPNGQTVKLNLNMPFGEKFPIHPTIDREGCMYNSFQNALAKRILYNHKKLVDESYDFLTSDWLYDLITLISNSVSLVDITLNQLYIKAEYDPLPNWKFDKERLGERHNRRLTDKIKWVSQITGNNLYDIEKELKSLKEIKDLRNHTQHFDPPCFGYSLEDVAKWLNMISDIGMLVHKIRKRLKSVTNIYIYEIILLPKVLINGNVLFDRNRVPQENTGYDSTRWKEY
ncbi:MAG: hypothetical protein JEZ05_11075 [Tenericutes bacterium]|nr:hypothetical protein [Mycoplasmatota bacterium]